MGLLPDPDPYAPRREPLRLLGPDGRPIERDDGLLLQNFRTFAAVYNAATRTYSWRFDEALRHSAENALAMRRDSFILGVMQERYLQLTGLDYHLEPEDQKDAKQKAVADGLTRIIDNTYRWRMMLWNLAEAIWYGRYGVQLEWKAVRVNGEDKLCVTYQEPVNGDKIQYGYDGVPKIMVGHHGMADLLKRNLVRKEDMERGQRSPQLVLRDRAWRQRFVIHKHNCTDADYFEAEMAGGVHGVGIRSQIYWGFHLRDEMLGWAVNHLKKIGVGGILVFYYEEGNDAAKTAAEVAARQAGERYAIAMPRPRGSGKDTARAELLPFSEAGVSALTTIIQDYFERHIERLIIGQELSSKAGSTGLGSGVSTFQEETKARILKFDARNLEDTLTEDFVKVAQQWNFPKANFRVRFKFDLPDPRADAKLQAAGVVFQMGTKIKADELLSAAGFSKAEEDDETVDILSLTKAQADITNDAQIEGQLKMAQLQQAMGLQAQPGMEGQPGAEGQPGMEQPGAEQAMPGEEMAGADLAGGGQAGMEGMPDPGAEAMPADAAMAPQMVPHPEDAPVATEEVPAEEQPAEEQPTEEAPAEPAPEEPTPEVADILAEILGEEPPPEGAADLSAEEEDRLWQTLAEMGERQAVPQQMLGLEDHVSYAEHAPAGGITLGGKEFVGGQFIPNAVLAKASPQEKAALQQAKQQPQGQPAPQQPAAQPSAQQPVAEPQQPVAPQAPAQSGLVNSLGEDPNSPVVPPEQWNDLVEVGLYGHKKFKAVPRHEQEQVFASAQRLAALTPKDFAREQGKVYERFRQNAPITEQDVYDAAACKLISAYRGKRSAAVYSRHAERQGVPKLVQDATKYVQKTGLKAMTSKTYAKKAVNDHLIGSWMRDQIAPSMGVDRDSIDRDYVAPAMQKAAQEAADQGMDQKKAAAHVAKAASVAEDYAEGRVAAKRHLLNVAAKVGADTLDYLMRVGINALPGLLDSFINRKKPQYHIYVPGQAEHHAMQGDDTPTTYLVGEELPAAYVAEDGAVVPYEYEPVSDLPADPDAQWQRAVQVLANWLRDRLLLIARGTGWPIPRADWDRWASTSAEAMAPHILKVLEARAEHAAETSPG